MEPVSKYLDDEASLKDEVLNYLLSKPNGAETNEIFNFFRNRNNYQFPYDWYSFKLRVLLIKFKEKTRRISQEEELYIHKIRIIIDNLYNNKEIETFSTIHRYEIAKWHISENFLLDSSLKDVQLLDTQSLSPAEPSTNKINKKISNKKYQCRICKRKFSTIEARHDHNSSKHKSIRVTIVSGGLPSLGKRR
ncbi:MAG TPA: hypothetical protein P5102_14305 [Candidatus Competibacteraceae bacterium]|nr:hypothetical protein [Candidatus Competibacteraceae bacterium]HRZ07295.1 hypothetical protein [Candidatus Competibacteraceae bacterium]